MPFKSKAQIRYMFAEHPRIAKRWAKKQDGLKNLPEKTMKKEGKFFKIPIKFKDVIGKPANQQISFVDDFTSKFLSQKPNTLNVPNPKAANKIWPMK